MRFQKRDDQLLRAIYDHDGVLAKRHLKEMFWTDASQRAMEKRLSILHQANYLAWPARTDWRERAIPEPVCWLGWRGALWIAGSCGVEVEPPTRINESWLRQLVKYLRKHGVRWLREPRWSLLAHDLAVVDVRLAVEKSARESGTLVLESWLPESTFLTQMDSVEFQAARRNRRTRMMKKGVRPDGFFEVVDKKRLSDGKPARARFLLELDNATHDNARFGSDKVIPGLAYLQSPAYRKRFGANAGRWLVVTTGKVRMKHLMRQTKRSVGAGASVFFFSTLDAVQLANVLTAPIWWQVGVEDPRSLFNNS